MEKFIVDNNVGKLAKWLRIMGYDALFFSGTNDSRMIEIALAEHRVVLTKDTQIMRRRVVTSGQIRAILIKDDDPEDQLHQVMETLKLDYQFKPFSICLECNQSLVARSKEEVRGLVPPYVFRTQNQYMQCPDCSRVYWRGTHWQAMERWLREAEGSRRVEPL